MEDDLLELLVQPVSVHLEGDLPRVGVGGEVGLASSVQYRLLSREEHLAQHHQNRPLVHPGQAVARCQHVPGNQYRDYWDCYVLLQGRRD